MIGGSRVLGPETETLLTIEKIILNFGRRLRVLESLIIIVYKLGKIWNMIVKLCALRRAIK